MSKEPKQKKQVEEQTTPQDRIPELLKEQKDAPSQRQIDDWKTQYGDIFISGFSENEIFVWRAISRSEFVTIQTAAVTGEGLTPFAIEEQTVACCLLWPLGVDLNKKGGTISTLSEQIMLQSHFLNQQHAAHLVAKL